MIHRVNADRWIVSLFAATFLLLPSAALADDDSSQSTGSTRIQIQRPRDPLKASAAVEHDLGSLNNDEAAKLRAIFAQQAEGNRPTNLRGGAAQEDPGFRGQTPMLDRVLKGQSNQSFFRAKAQQQQQQGPDNAPYIWCQSVNGGYYDCTNTYKSVVPGYRLKELGGKFVDGTPVPRGNVKMNEAGHVWWQNDLSPSFKHY
ncbi:MAG: hypothetical protein K2Y39_07835 [Candidatus Obscuribacterales bacterium]|nr:hypothetical protein [Candidatus Obscuribacterales bacterium]